MDWDFAKSTVVDRLEAVPQDFRGLYVPDGDKFKLGSDHPGVQSAVAAITGLHRALVASRAEANTYKGRAVDLSPLAEFGDNPNAILDGINAKLADVKKAKGVEDVDKAVKSAREALQAEHKRQMDAKEAREKALTGQLHQLLIGQAATAALVEVDVLDVDLAMPHVTANVRAVDGDSGLDVVVIGTDGQPRFSGVTGKHLTIKELVAEMKGSDKFAPLFKSKAGSGGGAPPASRRVAGTQTPRTPQEKIDAGLAARRGR